MPSSGYSYVTNKDDFSRLLNPIELTYSDLRSSPLAWEQVSTNALYLLCTLFDADVVVIALVVVSSLWIYNIIRFQNPRRVKRFTARHPALSHRPAVSFPPYTSPLCVFGDKTADVSQLGDQEA